MCDLYETIGYSKVGSVPTIITQSNKGDCSDFYIYVDIQKCCTVKIGGVDIDGDDM